ncbi:acetyltransferase [Metabacillus indicus]|uniref:acetyltransferase n=1 Tax=Metabacillus indicus TaxID=246786 RepID=UPI003CEEF203
MRWGIIGTGGHSKTVLEALMSKSTFSKVTFYTKFFPDSSFFNSYKVVRVEESASANFDQSIEAWHVAIGDVFIRDRKMQELINHHRQLPPILHDHSCVSKSASIGAGSFINAGAVINADAYIGKGCIINTLASVDHDCIISDYVNIGPGSNLAGTVTVGSRTDIGTGVSIIPGITIGTGCIIGAGSVVVRDVPDNTLVYGAPARVIKKINPDIEGNQNE